jgi:hypothetical protein
MFFSYGFFHWVLEGVGTGGVQLDLWSCKIEIHFDLKLKGTVSLKPIKITQRNRKTNILL